MSSQRQIDANRLNAQKSTGPSTPEARAAVGLNSLKYGLYAETLILPGEDPAAFEALLDRLDAEHQPATPTEEAFCQPDRHGHLAPGADPAHGSRLLQKQT